MQLMEVGDLLPGAKKIDNQNVNPVWRGLVQMPNRKRITAYIKRVSNRELVVEVIAAVLGRMLGLPIPRPLLVRVIPIHLAGAKLDKAEIFFASERVDLPDFARFLTPAGAASAMSALTRWPEAVATGCFDEWLANHDRHLHNILYDGRREFTLIDHSHALKPNLKADSLAQDNILIRLVTKSAKTQGEVRKVRTRANTALLKYQGLNVCEFLNDTLKSQLDEYHKCSEMVDFLETRLNYLGTLIEHRLGNQQRDLLHDPLAQTQSP